MRSYARHLYRYVLVGGALVALSCASGGTWAQQNGNNNPDPGVFQTQGLGQMQVEGDIHWDDWVAFNQFLDAHPDIADALRANPDLIYDTGFMGQHPDLKGFCDAHPGLQQDMGAHRDQFRDWFRLRRELAVMGQFLDSHQDLEKQITANPSLIDNQKYLQDHPQLRDFMNDHPEVRQAFDQNPTRFMNLEVRFQIGMNDRTELMYTRQFFDAHPDIEQELRANPSLIDNQSYVQNHPQLQDFLNGHPKTRQVFDQNPAAFMSLEVRVIQREDAATVPDMDQFLRTHPEIAKQLQANPSLINNPKYLKDNPALRTYLDGHPDVRIAFTQNPSMFFNRLGQQAANQPSDVATMDAYLDKHPDIARDLNAYPARINDSDYLAHHKDLAAFLKKHPQMGQEFTHNPSAFMRQESSFDACAQMDDFLDAHKDVGRELSQNPTSVKDAAYLNHHKDLKSFLDKNPGVSDQFQNNPNGFMDREKHFEANRQMDDYLTKHKGVAKDLQKNPDQVKDARYLDHHKDLRQLLDKNPQLAEAANTNPSAFMQDQLKFQQDYKSQQTQEKTKVEQRATTHGPQ